MEKSSFTRRTKKQSVVLPKGCKASVFNGQLLVSTGLHELDDIFGGGFAVGTVLLLEEDTHSSFYTHLLKYYLSEGLAVDHAVNYISAEDQTSINTFFKQLPKNLTFQRQEEEELLKQEEDAQQKQSEGKGMTIAWQYEKYLAPGGSGISIQHGSLKAKQVSAFCHSYDLNRPIKPESLQVPTLSSLSISTLKQEHFYRELYQYIYNQIAADFKSDAGDKTQQRTILRIGIESLGSPLWPDIKSDNGRELLMFLHALRGMLRSSLAVCMITLPSHLIPSSLVRKIEHLADTVIRIQSFAGTGMPVTDAFSDFDGQFFVVKLPRLNSLVSHLPETLNYIFKLGRRKLHIEIPHMGPAESRTTKERTSDNLETPKTLTDVLCQPGLPDKPSKIDF